MNIRFGSRVKGGRVRVFRHPQTGELKVRIQGELIFPARAKTAYLSVETFLDIDLEDAMALDLRDQLSAFVEAPGQGSEREAQGSQVQDALRPVRAQELG